MQQQAEIIQKQAEEARNREDELTRPQNQLFEAFIQRFPVPQDENRASPIVEQMGSEVRVQPPQPQQELQADATGSKLACERFMKRNPPVFEGTVYPAVAKKWVSMIEKIFKFA